MFPFLVGISIETLHSAAVSCDENILHVKCTFGAILSKAGALGNVRSHTKQHFCMDATIAFECKLLSRLYWRYQKQPHSLQSFPEYRYEWIKLSSKSATTANASTRTHPAIINRRRSTDNHSNQTQLQNHNWLPDDWEWLVRYAAGFEGSAINFTEQGFIPWSWNGNTGCSHYFIGGEGS